MQAVDLVADCPDQIVSSQPASRAASPITAITSNLSVAPSPSMGQRPSSVGFLRPKISLTWVLRNQQQQQPQELQEINTISVERVEILKDQQSIIDLQQNNDIISEISKEHDEKERFVRRSVKSVKSIKSVKSVKNSDGCKSKEKNKENINHSEKHETKNITLHRIDKIDKTNKMLDKDNSTVISTKNGLEKHLEKEYQAFKESKENKEKVKRAISEPNLITRETDCPSNGREKHRHRRSKRSHRPKIPSKFGYEIADLDSFLTKASIEHPANIPVVLSFSSVLYQTQGGTQAEIALPLGTVVNAVFKNQTWLYVQTPHGQEGYVGYAACLPLGILPQSTRGPCWEDSTDVFPRPLGNLTDTEKLRDTRSECGDSRHPRDALSIILRKATSTHCGTSKRSVEQLYLQAPSDTRRKGTRHTLLLVPDDYESQDSTQTLSVTSEVVTLLADNAQTNWLWVRTRESPEDFIPALVTRHD